MNNWHRNLFTGVDHTPDVAGDARLVVVEDGGGPALPVQWMTAVGLDRSVARRGIAVMPAATADGLAGTPGLRVLRPIGPRLRSEG
jgi:hypothetical protein